MKQFFFLLLLVPSLFFAQEGRLERSIKAKVMMVQQFVAKGEKGEEAFWQTKGRVTFPIVKYTEQQNPVFRDLFIRHYNELLPVYNKMISSYDDRDTQLFVQILIRQEEEFRALLQEDQLATYRKTLLDFESSDQKQADAYNSLFFSDVLLAEYKARTKS